MTKYEVRQWEEWVQEFPALSTLPAKNKTNIIYNNHIKKYNKYLKNNKLKNNMESVTIFFNNFKIEKVSKGKTIITEARANTKRLAVVALKRAFLSIPKLKNDLRYRMIVNAAFKEGLKIDKPDPTVDQDQVLTKEELNLIFNSTTPRTSALMQFIYSTGCRVSEAIGARVANVRKNGNVKILIGNTKNKKERVLLCDPDVYKFVEKVYQGKTFIFESESGRQLISQNVYKVFTRDTIQRLVPGKRINPHWLRHTRITHLFESGWDEKAVQKFAGHSDVSVTLRAYTHTQVNSQKLQQQDADSGVFKLSRKLKTGKSMKAMTAASVKARAAKKK